MKVNGKDCPIYYGKLKPVFYYPPQKNVFFPPVFFWGKNVADRRQNLALSLESTL